MKVVLASNNTGKIEEITDLLKNHHIAVHPQSEFGVSEIEETGLTFIENAILKARHAAHATGLPAIADDSGLVVDALTGAPGIYSSRYAGGSATAQDNIKKLLQAMEKVPHEKRTAYFYCTLVFMRHAKDPTPLFSEGRWPGLILHKPQGHAGFGYDPVFYVPSENKTAAELPPQIKNRMSHRGIALQLLLKSLLENL